MNVGPDPLRRSANAGAFFRCASKQQECGRRHAVEARGLSKARRTVALELLLELVGEPGDGAISEVARDGDALLFAECGDVQLLPLEVDRVARVDRELRGDVRTERADLGPDLRQPREIDIRISEQLKRSSLAPVAIDGKAVLGGFAGREREALQQRFAVGERPRLGGEGCCPLAADAADRLAERREALIGIVGAQA